MDADLSGSEDDDDDDDDDVDDDASSDEEEDENGLEQDEDDLVARTNPHRKAPGRGDPNSRRAVASHQKDSDSDF